MAGSCPGCRRAAISKTFSPHPTPGFEFVSQTWVLSCDAFVMLILLCTHRLLTPGHHHLPTKQVWGSQAHADATMALLRRISLSPSIMLDGNDADLELFLRDQLGPVLGELQYFQPVFSRLTHLNLRGCDVQPKGGAMLAGMLRQCHRLEVGAVVELWQHRHLSKPSIPVQGMGRGRGGRERERER